MNPIKIFDMPHVYTYINYETELISVDSIFYDLNGKYWDAIQNIINIYIIHNETFETIMSIASKLVGTAKNNMVVYDPSAIGSGWRIHPILLKSVLRHIESVFPYKTMLANVIHSIKPKKGIDIIKSRSLLSIVSNVPYQTRIKYNSSDERGKEYKCNGILNKNDMFNDDTLIRICTKQITNEILILLIQRCLRDVIISYVSL
jgi:hypothetical protein